MGAVIDWAAWVPGGRDGLADDLRAGTPRGTRAADPERPEWLSFGVWRKMTRLSRAAAVTAGGLLQAHPEVSRATLPVVWGSQLGEVVPGSAFLDRWFTEGPDRVSPASFQSSVYNATAGWLSIAAGLTGPQETVCAGAATGVAALARGLEWLDRAPHVLVAAGDAWSRSAELAYGAAGLVGGEGVVAVLLGRGQRVRVSDGAGEATIARAKALPNEPAFTAVAAAVHPERALGHCATNELLAWLVLGGVAVAQDDGAALTLA